MACVVLLRGINVGGHRTFRPARLAEQLKHLDVVNIGAAGTFVIGARTTRTELRAELARYLGALDRLFGVPVTTGNWNTVAAIASVLNGRP